MAMYSAVAAEDTSEMQRQPGSYAVAEIPEKKTKKSNAFTKAVRKIYNTIGFKKGYNFVFFFITAGALLGFCLAEIRKVNVSGYWLDTGAAPGEAYYFKLPRYRVGMQIHLGTIIPAGILVVFQFLPFVRYKAIMVHRLNGWLVTMLLFVSNAGALMITDRSFGGKYDTRVFIGILATFSTVAAVMGIVNIKRKQIDQHRKWMIRCWVYCGSIITLRLIQIIGILIIAQLGGFYTSMNCGQLGSMGGNTTNYPSCALGGDAAYTSVVANFDSENVEEISASLQMAFGSSGLMALTLHAVLVEIYFHLTPTESERLRKVAYDRQLERGHKHPGSSGLTSDRLGDAPWYDTVVSNK